jgi:hypothetical protein
MLSKTFSYLDTLSLLSLITFLIVDDIYKVFQLWHNDDDDLACDLGVEGHHHPILFVLQPPGRSLGENRRTTCDKK